MTTFPHPFTRIQIAGGLFGIEQWSINLSIANGDGAGRRPTQADADGVLGAFRTWIAGGAGSPVTNRVQIHQVKMARIGVNGLYQDAAPTVAVQPLSGSTGTGSTGGPPHPAQIALAVTLEGEQPRARAGRGRFYLPSPAYAVDSSDGRITSANALTVAQGAATFLQSVNGVVDGRVIIMGPTTALSAGDSQEVVRIGVGRVLDTIRSRRAALAEERVYAPAAITDSGGNA